MEGRDVWGKIRLIKAEFKNAEGSFVLPIALKLRGRWLEVVEPAFDEFDSSLTLLGRTERRGGLYYLDNTVDVLLYLVEEGGRRDIRVSVCRLTPKQCKLIKEAAHQAWVAERAPPRQVEKLLESLDLTVISPR